MGRPLLYGDASALARGVWTPALWDAVFGSSTKVLTAPSGDEVGRIEAAAALADVVLGPGNWNISRTVSTPGGRTISALLPEKTRVIAANWSITGADSRSNALFSVLGTSLPLAATTALDTAYMGEYYLHLSSNAGLSTGMWLSTSGDGSADDSRSPGTPAPPTVCRLLSGCLAQIANVLSGGWVELVDPLPITVKAGKTIDFVAAAENVTFQNLILDGANLAAVGIYIKNGSNVRVTDCAVKNFTRAAVDELLAIRTEVARADDWGGNNAILHSDQCHRGSTPGPWRASRQGPLVNALGIPRGKITQRNRCCLYRHDFQFLSRGTVALRWWGGRQNYSSAYVADNFDATPACTRDPEIIANHVGTLFDGGPGPLEIADWDDDSVIEGMQATNHRHPAVLGTGIDAPCLVYKHDKRGAIIGYIKGGPIVSNSPAGQGMDYRAQGLKLHDCSGSVGLVEMSGIPYALMTAASQAVSRVTTFTMRGNTMKNEVVSIPVLFDHGAQDGVPAGPRIESLELPDAGNGIRFGATFVGSPDWLMRIGRYQWGAGEWFDVRAAYASGTATLGDVWKLDPTSPAGAGAQKRRIVVAGGATTAPVAIAVGAPFDLGTNTVVLIAPLPGRGNFVNVKVATSLGVTLESDATNKTVTPATAFDTLAGRAGLPTSAGGLTLVLP